MYIFVQVVTFIYSKFLADFKRRQEGGVNFIISNVYK